MCYLNIDTENVALTFRLDMDAQDHLWWPQALQKCGVTERKEVARETNITLKDVLATPQFAAAFKKYMEENFLTEVRASRRQPSPPLLPLPRRGSRLLLHVPCADPTGLVAVCVCAGV